MPPSSPTEPLPPTRVTRGAAAARGKVIPS